MATAAESPRPTGPDRVLIVGTGLIGTSIALALRARGVSVWLSDIDADSAALAAGLGAGTVVADLRAAKGIADVAVLAMPPESVGEMLLRAQDAAVAEVYTDVASVKALPAERVREMGCDLDSYVPGHPLAGRERHGPAAARADLFLGRTWALCPLPETAPSAVAAASALARACGAEVVVTDTETHDAWVALVSHAPHVVSSAMAARLAAGDVPDDALRLAGQGLRDVTRIAAGDTALWTQILSANAAPVAEILTAVADDLTAVAASLAPPAPAAPPVVGSTGNGWAIHTPIAVSTAHPSGGRGGESERSGEGGSSGEGGRGGEGGGSGEGSAVEDLLDRGRTGVARIPGKRGDAARSFAVVQVVMADRPGELAALFGVAGDARVNVEDVRIEHSPGHPTGVAEIAVRPDQAAALVNALCAGGWTARR